MARKSFTLRKYETLENQVVYRPSSVPASVAYFGSYLAYPSGSAAASSSEVFNELSILADNDTRLKSDGILLPPILNNPIRSGQLLPYISFFDATVTDYNEVVLTWDAPLTDINEVSDENLVVATEIVIVYSNEGEPQTISDGQILVSDATSQSHVHRVESGAWAYYTLFVKFQSQAGDLYYEPSAKLGVITPRRYGSVDYLYGRIPEYYRILDGDMDEGYGGPLYRYLSIFGYEIDRVRTIIDHMMIMKDPQIANSEVLDYISQDLGIGVRVNELGASRLRTLINIIGYLRRSEGTSYSLELAMQALTNSDVEIDLENKEVKVYAQRVNLLKDPQLKALITGVLDGGFPSTTSFSFDLLGDRPDSVLNPNSWTIDTGWTYNPSDPDQPGNIITFEADMYEGGSASATGGGTAGTGEPAWTYDLDPEAEGIGYVFRSFSDYIAVKTGDTLYYSMQLDPASGAQDKIYKITLTISDNLDTIVIAESTSNIKIGGINYWELEVVEGYEDYVNAYINIYVQGEVDSSQFGKMLLERSSGGTFFDGDTTLGGWLVDADTVSDYRWYREEFPPSGGGAIAPTDWISLYNSNYSKTKAVVNRMLPSYLPVTELTTGEEPVYYGFPIPSPKWSVTFNHVPGITQP